MRIARYSDRFRRDMTREGFWTMSFDGWRTALVILGLGLVGLPASCGGDEGGGGGNVGSGGAAASGGSGGSAASGGSGGSAGTSGAPSGGAAGSGGSAGSDASTDADAGDAGDAGGACNTIVNTSGVVELVAVAAQAPAQTGGAITQGKYVLTEYTQYTGADGGVGPTGSTLKETLMISAATLDGVQAEGSVEAGIGADQRYTHAYTAAGNTLALAPSCGPFNGLAVKYTASTSDAGVTTLAVAVGKTVAIYTKQ